MNNQNQGKGIGKILDKDHMLNSTNSHINNFSAETATSVAAKKKSEIAESKGALKRGTIVIAKLKQAEIVESEIKDNGQFKYYLTFKDCNRRMDTWVDEINLKPEEV